MRQKKKNTGQQKQDWIAADLCNTGQLPDQGHNQVENRYQCNDLNNVYHHGKDSIRALRANTAHNGVVDELGGRKGTAGQRLISLKVKHVSTLSR
ncbi:hypothetical protein [Ruegeria arenilitoris]|uniref:hypothetical protein n=1 Tax=Ruegeria arenilitoris TaxID=1173585 RepID=UPI003463FAA7